MIEQEVGTRDEELRILSFNIWGLPVVAPNRRKRYAKLLKLVEELELDVVLLQEVWLQTDQSALIRQFQRIGFPYTSVIGQGGTFQSGLFAASKYPQKNHFFTPFSDKKIAKHPYHIDWIARKGFGGFTTEIHGEPLLILNTHLQAGYGTTDYEITQTQQILDITTWLDSEVPKIARYFANRDPAVIMAGDLNTTWPSTPFQLLQEEANFSGVLHPQRIDAMLFRSGTHLQIRVTQAEYLLENSLWPTNRGAISDHPAIFTRFGLTNRIEESCAVKTKRPMDFARTKHFQQTCKARMAERTRRAKKYSFAGLILLLVFPFGPHILGYDGLGLFSGCAIIGLLLLWCSWWWYQAGPVSNAEQQIMSRLDAYFAKKSGENSPRDEKSPAIELSDHEK